MSSRNGFTLIEVMVILVIMGILLVVTIPPFRGYLESNRLVGTSNVLIADIHYVRSLATAQRRTHEIEFDPHEYRIVVPVSGKVIRTRQLSNWVSCAATGNPNFYAWGLTDPVTITLTAGSKQKTLLLMPNGSVSRP
jgi:prepilin-type N-terminal cleavage/methylation domain-containing protein